MKRKAIQLANQTIVVSLPAKWVKQQGIKKGDEIDVDERGKELVIGVEEIKSEKGKKIEINIDNLNDRVVRWVLSSLHKKGYDEIVIKYDKPFFTKTIEELIKDLFIGFVIVEQKENSCILKSVSKDLESEFDIALRRAFLVTLSIGESCSDMIKQGKLANLKELVALEHTNNQLTNFCERILNKREYGDYEKTCFMYTIVWNLEKVCDEYKCICEYLSLPENNKTKINKEVISLFNKVNNFFESYYKLFYKFDINKLNELAEERKEIEKNIRKIYKTKIKDKEMVIINYLLNIATRTVDFSASMFALNL